MISYSRQRWGGLLGGVLILGMMLPIIVSAGESILKPTVYHVRWEGSDYAMDSHDIHYDSSSENALGIRYSYLFDTGLAVGGEFIIYDKDFTTLGVGNSYSGWSHVYHAMAHVAYHFNREGMVQPYLGGGLAVTQVSFHSTTEGPNARVAGYDVHGFAGIRIQFNRRIGIGLEYKHIAVDADDRSGNELVTDIDMLALGLVFKF